MTSIEVWLTVGLVVVGVGALLALRRLRHGPAVPLANATALEAPARRTTLLRVCLLVALTGLVLAAAALSREPRDKAADLLASGGTTVVVLDMSASVSDLVYSEIARSLRAIADAGEQSSPPAKIGLVLFSDAAQEALPPGTAPNELRPFMRYFLPKTERSTRPRPVYYRQAGPAALPPTQYPLSPWFAGFSGGTAISTGLSMARETLERDAVSGGQVLLISDLDDAGSDFERLTAELVAYSTQGIPLHVVALPPAFDAQKEMFRRLTGSRSSIVDSVELSARADAMAPVGSGLSVVVLLLAILIGLALAVNEFFAAPLRWGRTAPGSQP